MAERDLAFENVLSGRRAEKRTALIVFPVVVVLAVLIGFAAVSISRTSALTSEVNVAKGQLAEANKAVEERDNQLRAARAEAAALSTPGQGAAVLAAVKGEGASGLARIHPEQHMLAVFAYNLAPPPDGQEYRLIVSDASGHESMLGALAPDERGGAGLLARDVPEGASKVEVALVAKSVAGAAPKPAGGSAPASSTAGRPAGGERQPVLAGTLPKPGEAGVIMPEAAPGSPRAQARAPGGGRRRASR